MSRRVRRVETRATYLAGLSALTTVEADLPHGSSILAVESWPTVYPTLRVLMDVQQLMIRHTFVVIGMDQEVPVLAGNHLTYVGTWHRNESIPEFLFDILPDTVLDA